MYFVEMSDWEGPLDALRWHWGDAYLISFYEPDTWVAQRRDNRETICSDSPADLRDLIREDYRVRPVGRQLAGGVDRPDVPSCRFPPEGLRTARGIIPPGFPR
jgi:hypothetical protein